MKKHLLRSLLAVITILLGSNAAWADEINATLVHTASSGVPSATAGAYVSTIDAAQEYINNSAFGNKNWQGAAYAEFSFVIPEGQSIKSASMVWNGVGSNKDRTTDVMYVSAGEALDYSENGLGSGTAEVNLPATKITTVTFPKNTTKEFTTDVTDAVKAVAGTQSYVIFKFTNNVGAGNLVGKGAESGAPTLVITTADASSMTSYTVKFTDGTNELKDAAVYTNVAIGSEQTASTADMASFIVGDKKYIYVSGNTTITTVAEASSNVITLVFREAATYNYTIKSSLGTTISEGTGFEGDEISYYFPEFQLSEGTLFSTTKNSNMCKNTVTLDADNKVITVDYSATETTNVVFLKEAEDIEGATASAASNADIRCSMGKGAFFANDVTVTTLQPGKYKLTAQVWGNATTTFAIKAGEATVLSIDTKGYIYSETSEEFEILSDTEITIPTVGNENRVLDLIYIQKTGDVTAEEIALAEAKAALQADIDAAKAIDTTGKKLAESLANAITEAETQLNAAEATVENLQAAQMVLAKVVETYYIENAKNIFLKPGLWNKDGARYAAYVWDAKGNTWFDFQSAEGDSIFTTQIPENYTGLILARMDGTTEENNWDKKWNQTADINFAEVADSTLFTITGWGEGENAKSTYEASKYEKAVAPTKYTITITETENGTVVADKAEAAEGETVTVTVTPAEGYKVNEAGWSYGETSNEFTEPEEGNAVTFTMPAANVTITVTFKAVEPEAEPAFYLIGTMTETPWTVSEDNKMVLNEAAEGEEYMLTKEMTAGTEFKVVKAAGNNIQTWYLDGQENYTIAADGTYIVYFRPKADGGDDWYNHEVYVLRDYNSFIVNADLTGEGGFDATGTKGISGGIVKAGNNAQFDFKQTIENLPAGKYKVTAHAAYRYSNDENQAEQIEYNAIQAGTETKFAKLYATVGTKTVETLVQNRWDGASDTDYANGNGSVTVNEKFVPNSSAAVKAWFEAGKYVNEVIFNLPADGDVTIGIVKTAQPEAGDYTVIGPWTLTRLGDAEEEPAEQNFTATFNNGDNWENVYAYTWTAGEPVVEQLGAWPGTKLEKNAETSLYDVTITAVEAPQFIIFNNGLENEALQQTADLAFVNEKAYEYRSIPELAGWTKVTSANIENVADNYYVLVDADSYNYVMSNEADHYRPCYKTVADPVANPSFVWSLEGSDNTFAIKSFSTGSYFIAPSNGWDTSMTGATGSATFQFTQNDGIYTLKCVQSNALVGHWNDSGAAVAEDGENIAANKQAKDAPGFYLYAMPKATYEKAILAARTEATAGASKENGIDVTAWIQNADWTGDFGGWARSGSWGNMQWGQKTLEVWNATNVVVKQTLTAVPDGTYKLTADVISGNGDNKVAFVYGTGGATEKSDAVSAVASAGNYNTMSDEVAGNTLTADNIVVTGGVLTVGLDIAAGWIVADNFKLYYYGEDMSQYAQAYHDALTAAQAIDTTAPMNGEVLTALNTALTTYASVDETDKATLLAATTALSTATEAATASIAAYAKAAEMLPKMKQLTEETNVYTAEALASYYTQWADKYEAKTLTTEEANALQNPYTQTGWHDNITVDNFLLSAWDTNPDFVDAPYYINTWSTEGIEGANNYAGVPFGVPFFEYWTSDANSLGEKTLTATMSNLPEGKYNVTTLVRVRIKNGAETPAAGITLQANEGEAVDVTAGDQIGESQFFLKEFTATGTVAQDGVLNIKFSVAADNNISWLSFKNVKFTKYEEPVYTIVGNETAIFGEAWNPTAETNDMVKGEDGIYTKTYEGIELAAGTVYYKVVKNHSWDTNWGFPEGPDGNADYVVNEAGKYNITFSFNPNAVLENGFNVACKMQKAEEPQLPENVIYSWESPEGTPIEYGGTIAYVNGDGDRLNYQNSGYYTICLNGKKANLNDEAASANAGHMVITLDNAVAEGDTIAITGYITKNSSSKSSAWIVYENGSTTESAVFGDESNIFVPEGGEATGAISTKYVIVPAEAADSKTITLTRGQTGTNLFITKLQIMQHNPTTGISIVKTAIENGAIYNLNGQKVNKAQKGLYIINGKKVVIK